MVERAVRPALRRRRPLLARHGPRDGGRRVRTSWLPKTPTSSWHRRSSRSAPPDGPLRQSRDHDPRRHQGRPPARPRLRRGRAAAGLDQGAGRLRLGRRPPGRAADQGGAEAGPPRLRLRHGGERHRGRPLAAQSLDRRPARRHHQLPARPAALGDLDRARAAWRDDRRHRLRPLAQRAVQRRAAATAPTSTTGACGSPSAATCAWR